MVLLIWINQHNCWSLYRPHSNQINYWYLGDKCHSKGKAVSDFSSQKERMKTIEKGTEKVKSLLPFPEPFSTFLPCLLPLLPQHLFIPSCLRLFHRKKKVMNFREVTSFMSRFPWKGWGTTIVSDELPALRTQVCVPPGLTLRPLNVSAPNFTSTLLAILQLRKQMWWKLGVGIIENLGALGKGQQGIKLMNVNMVREIEVLQNLHFSYFHAKNASLPIWNTSKIEDIETPRKSHAFVTSWLFILSLLYSVALEVCWSTSWSVFSL